MDAAITIVMLVPILLAVALIVGVIRRNITERQEGGPVDIRGAIPAVIVLLVAVLVIGSMADVAEDRDYELYDCVPLASFGSGATVSGDCAEIVEIGGTEYVRMTGLGTFTVSADGSETTCKVGKAHMDLVLLTGQSNSVFYTNPEYYTDPSPVSPGKAFYLGSDNVQSFFGGVANPSDLEYSEVMDLVADDGSVRLSQMYPAFCSGYVQETGHRVLVVNTGIGGKGISEWDTGNDCDLWMESVMGRLSEVVSGSIVLKPTVALWSQGESNRDDFVDYYVGHFVPLLDKLWGGYYGGYGFSYVLSCLPRYPGYENPIASAQAQMDVASDHSRFRIASTLPLQFTNGQTRDSVHYTQEAYGWLGEAFAREAAEALGFEPEDQPIVLAEAVGAVAVLPGKVTAFGTSGEGFELDAEWTETGTAGVYEAALSGNPSGTVIAEGLTANATIAP